MSEFERNDKILVIDLTNEGLHERNIDYLKWYHEHMLSRQNDICKLAVKCNYFTDFFGNLMVTPSDALLNCAEEEVPLPSPKEEFLKIIQPISEFIYSALFVLVRSYIFKDAVTTDENNEEDNNIEGFFVIFFKRDINSTILDKIADWFQISKNHLGDGKRMLDWCHMGEAFMMIHEGIVEGEYAIGKIKEYMKNVSPRTRDEIVKDLEEKFKKLQEKPLWTYIKNEDESI